jgi:dihydroflavonol-4-reductase
MVRILVTGANGHVGANIVRSLLQRGYEVVPLVRPTSDLRGLSALNLTYAYGDVTDERSLVAAAAGCDVIIHTAAVYQLQTREPEAIRRPALAGTRNVLNAAKAAGVKRVIYTSTVWAVGLSTDPGVRLTASSWNADSRNPYAVAKTQAEKEAWRLAGELAIPLIVICPNGVVGQYDYRMTPSSRTLRDLVNGTQFTIDSGYAFVDVRDVAEIHALAVSGGEPGKRYLVAGENLHLRELGQLVGRLTGFTPRHIGLGRGPFYLAAVLVELAARLTNAEPPFTRELVHDMVGRYMFNDCRETWETFDYQPRAAEEMVGDAIRWLLYRGEIRAGRAAQLAGKFPPALEWLVA